MLRSVIECGECFVRLKIDRKNATVPLKLQVLEAEHLDSSKDYQLPNGNIIKTGIEFDKSGKRVAYYLYKEHPGDSGGGYETVRIPCRGINVTSIKKFITGKGNANKEEMIKAMNEQGFKVEDDNEADALGVLLKFFDQEQSQSLNVPKGQILKSTKDIGSSWSMRERGTVPQDVASVRKFSEVDERDARPIDCPSGGVNVTLHSLKISHAERCPHE